MTQVRVAPLSVRLGCAMVLVLLSAGFFSGGEAQVGIGTAHFVEWELPPTAGAAPQALTIDGTSLEPTVWYLTSRSPTSLVRFTPGDPVESGIAAWRSWGIQGIGDTGGLKVTQGGVVLAKTSFNVQRIDTTTNMRTVWTAFAMAQSSSDLAIDEQNSVYFTNARGGTPEDVFGEVQRLIPDGPTSLGATFSRWLVGRQAGNIAYSGVAIHPATGLVYYSEPGSPSGIAELDPVTNTVRRWTVAAVAAFGPGNLTIDDAGVISAVTASGHIVRLNPTTNEMTSHLIPTPASFPIAIASNGIIAFTEHLTNKIGMLIPGGTPVVVPPSVTAVPRIDEHIEGTQATLVPQDGIAMPEEFPNQPTTETATEQTGIFIEAQLPPGSFNPYGIGHDHVSAPATFYYTLRNTAQNRNRIGRIHVPGVAPPATLTLEPAAGMNPVGTEHCVTATVRDAFSTPTPGITVQFTVTGSIDTSGSATTDANGQATFCYTGPTTPGVDAITAYADTNNSNTPDAGEPSGAAAKTWVSGPPATLILTPPAASNPVGSQHCVTATVRDAFSNPTPGVVVQFTVTGSVTTAGSATTDADDEATFCYVGPELPGADAITAYADTDGDSTQDPGEPTGAAAKAWVLPPTTADCTVTGGGRITANNGDQATFGGNAHSSGPTGDEEYTDHGPATPMQVKSINVQAVVCSADHTQASIYGEATVNGATTVNYLIQVKDLGEPGRQDTYRIVLSNGYDSGEHTLEGGNIQIQ